MPQQLKSLPQATMTRQRVSAEIYALTVKVRWVIGAMVSVDSKPKDAIRRKTHIFVMFIKQYLRFIFGSRWLIRASCLVMSTCSLIEGDKLMDLIRLYFHCLRSVVGGWSRVRHNGPIAYEMSSGMPLISRTHSPIVRLIRPY